MERRTAFEIAFDATAEVDPDPTSVHHLRPDVKASLDAWARDATPPSGFLERVLCNDLVGAFKAADRWNLANMAAIAAYVYSTLPSACWGSPKKVLEWHRVHRLTPT